MFPDQLIVFAKAPRAGLVKTRLAHTLGAQEACDAYRTLAETLLANLRTIQGVQLRFAPDEAAGELEAWRRPGIGPGRRSLFRWSERRRCGSLGGEARRRR